MRVPFCTLSHSKKISSPPFTQPLFLLTRQILSSAVFGAPDDAETHVVNMQQNRQNKSDKSDCIQYKVRFYFVQYGKCQNLPLRELLY